MRECKGIGILETALYNADSAARHLDLDEDVWLMIRSPRERIEISENPMLFSGKTIGLKTFVVRHNDALGPAKGGIRMSASVTLDDITGLAMEMTWKTSLIGVPFGGGKAGIRINPAHLQPNDKEIIIRSFTRGARRHIGPEIYIPAPDMGTNETDMAHIRSCIAYSSAASITNGCYVTGKPPILGGIVGRREATGKGVAITIGAACRKQGLDLENCRVAVQGFGNVGSIAAAEIAKHGAKIIGVADLSGGTGNGSGLDIDRLAAHVRKTGGVKGFDGGTAFEKDAIFEMECDILVPAAGASQITRDNAGKVKAKIIAEGANAPTTPEADDILNERKVFIIPDILCNAGGVFVSYLEYTQETQREQMTLAEVERRLGERMIEKFNQIFEYSSSEKLTMRSAAMGVAIRRVVEAVMVRGLLP